MVLESAASRYNLRKRRGFNDRKSGESDGGWVGPYGSDPKGGCGAVRSGHGGDLIFRSDGGGGYDPGNLAGQLERRRGVSFVFYAYQELQRWLSRVHKSEMFFDFHGVLCGFLADGRVYDGMAGGDSAGCGGFKFYGGSRGLLLEGAGGE